MGLTYLNELGNKKINIQQKQRGFIITNEYGGPLDVGSWTEYIAGLNYLPNKFIGKLVYVYETNSLYVYNNQSRWERVNDNISTNDVLSVVISDNKYKQDKARSTYFTNSDSFFARAFVTVPRTANHTSFKYEIPIDNNIYSYKFFHNNDKELLYDGGSYYINDTKENLDKNHTGVIEGVVYIAGKEVYRERFPYKIENNNNGYHIPEPTDAPEKETVLPFLINDQKNGNTGMLQRGMIVSSTDGGLLDAMTAVDDVENASGINDYPGKIAFSKSENKLYYRAVKDDVIFPDKLSDTYGKSARIKDFFELNKDNLVWKEIKNYVYNNTADITVDIKTISNILSGNDRIIKMQAFMYLNINGINYEVTASQFNWAFTDYSNNKGDDNITNKSTINVNKNIITYTALGDDDDYQFNVNVTAYTHDADNNEVAIKGSTSMNIAKAYEMRNVKCTITSMKQGNVNGIAGTFNVAGEIIHYFEGNNDNIELLTQKPSSYKLLYTPWNNTGDITYLSDDVNIKFVSSKDNIQTFTFTVPSGTDLFEMGTYKIIPGYTATLNDGSKKRKDFPKFGDNYILRQTINNITLNPATIYLDNDTHRLTYSIEVTGENVAGCSVFCDRLDITNAVDVYPNNDYTSVVYKYNDNTGRTGTQDINIDIKYIANTEGFETRTKSIIQHIKHVDITKLSAKPSKYDAFIINVPINVDAFVGDNGISFVNNNATSSITYNTVSNPGVVCWDNESYISAISTSDYKKVISFKDINNYNVYYKVILPSDGHNDIIGDYHNTICKKVQTIEVKDFTYGGISIYDKNNDRIEADKIKINNTYTAVANVNEITKNGTASINNDKAVFDWSFDNNPNIEIKSTVGNKVTFTFVNKDNTKPQIVLTCNVSVYGGYSLGTQKIEFSMENPISSINFTYAVFSNQKYTNALTSYIAGDGDYIKKSRNNTIQTNYEFPIFKLEVIYKADMDYTNIIKDIPFAFYRGTTSLHVNISDNDLVHVLNYGDTIKTSNIEDIKNNREMVSSTAVNTDNKRVATYYFMFKDINKVPADTTNYTVEFNGLSKTVSVSAAVIKLSSMSFLTKSIDIFDIDGEARYSLALVASAENNDTENYIGKFARTDNNAVTDITTSASTAVTSDKSTTFNDSYIFNGTMPASGIYTYSHVYRIVTEKNDYNTNEATFNVRVFNENAIICRPGSDYKFNDGTYAFVLNNNKFYNPDKSSVAFNVDGSVRAYNKSFDGNYSGYSGTVTGSVWFNDEPSKIIKVNKNVDIHELYLDYDVITGDDTDTQLYKDCIAYLKGANPRGLNYYNNLVANNTSRYIFGVRFKITDKAIGTVLNSDYSDITDGVLKLAGYDVSVGVMTTNWDLPSNHSLRNIFRFLTFNDGQVALIFPKDTATLSDMPQNIDLAAYKIMSDVHLFYNPTIDSADLHLNASLLEYNKYTISGITSFELISKNDDKIIGANYTISELVIPSATINGVAQSNPTVTYSTTTGSAVNISGTIATVSDKPANITGTYSGISSACDISNQFTVKYNAATSSSFYNADNTSVVSQYTVTASKFVPNNLTIRISGRNILYDATANNAQLQMTYNGVTLESIPLKNAIKGDGTNAANTVINISTSGFTKPITYQNGVNTIVFKISGGESTWNGSIGINNQIASVTSVSSTIAYVPKYAKVATPLKMSMTMTGDKNIITGAGNSLSLVSKVSGPNATLNANTTNQTSNGSSTVITWPTATLTSGSYFDDGNEYIFGINYEGLSFQFHEYINTAYFTKKNAFSEYIEEHLDSDGIYRFIKNPEFTYSGVNIANYYNYRNLYHKTYITFDGDDHGVNTDTPFMYESMTDSKLVLSRDTTGDHKAASLRGNANLSCYLYPPFDSQYTKTDGENVLSYNVNILDRHNGQMKLDIDENGTYLYIDYDNFNNDITNLGLGFLIPCVDYKYSASSGTHEYGVINNNSNYVKFKLPVTAVVVDGYLSPVVAGEYTGYSESSYLFNYTTYNYTSNKFADFELSGTKLHDMVYIRNIDFIINYQNVNSSIMDNSFKSKVHVKIYEYMNKNHVFYDNFDNGFDNGAANDEYLYADCEMKNMKSSNYWRLTGTIQIDKLFYMNSNSSFAVEITPLDNYGNNSFISSTDASATYMVGIYKYEYQESKSYSVSKTTDNIFINGSISNSGTALTNYNTYNIIPFRLPSKSMKDIGLSVQVTATRMTANQVPLTYDVKATYSGEIYGTMIIRYASSVTDYPYHVIKFNGSSYTVGYQNFLVNKYNNNYTYYWGAPIEPVNNGMANLKVNGTVYIVTMDNISYTRD